MNNFWKGFTVAVLGLAAIVMAGEGAKKEGGK